jgi:hypothetical protein
MAYGHYSFNKESPNFFAIPRQRKILTALRIIIVKAGGKKMGDNGGSKC